jgi:hypothetical protein
MIQFFLFLMIFNLYFIFNKIKNINFSLVKIFVLIIINDDFCSCEFTLLFDLFCSLAASDSKTHFLSKIRFG